MPNFQITIGDWFKIGALLVAGGVAWNQLSNVDSAAAETAMRLETAEDKIVLIQRDTALTDARLGVVEKEVAPVRDLTERLIRVESNQVIILETLQEIKEELSK